MSVLFLMHVDEYPNLPCCTQFSRIYLIYSFIAPKTRTRNKYRLIILYEEYGYIPDN